MDEKDLISLMAFTWLNHGGDAEGFEYSYGRILARIKELEGEDA